MVVHDAGDLHEGVDRRGADAPEPSPHQVLAHGFRFGRLAGHLASVAEAACDGPVVHEAPAVVTERSELTDYLQTYALPMVSTSLLKVYGTPGCT